ncbi:hypothetical protein IRT45_21775 [Nocardia sp. BSTN01]|uniref:hypothetical protein n=1 Tax=Nocardia sp. BSTN01 TaxID=2783665 RepID=UPI00188EE4B2|nr:hypothetical protein [Nocardia sp. BSTN01]MBF4999775.1 hypothetical protein [Nocardia sp. BSTN01]
MGADDAKPPAQRPLAGLIEEAKAGRLNVRMDLEKFVYIDRDCNFFKENISAIQQLMTLVSNQTHWGLGEDHVADGERDLVSSKTMVKRWREKAQGSANSVYSVLDTHFQTVSDFQTLFRTIREQMAAQDQATAARYRELEKTLPQQNPAPQRLLGAFGLHFGE